MDELGLVSRAGERCHSAGQRGLESYLSFGAGGEARLRRGFTREALAMETGVRSSRDRTHLSLGPDVGFFTSGAPSAESPTR